MPALLRAWRVGEKAASIGIDWTDEAGPRGKLDEELGELDQAIERADAPGASEAAVGEVTAELGDALFSLVNLARKRGIDPEAALRGTIDRFAGRVARVESLCRARSCSSADLDASTLDALWAQAKAASNEGS